tara:strand:- start:3590 stop:4030 length:441 start_codon:yes stop_codon:yes gene_type:complete
MLKKLLGKKSQKDEWELKELDKGNGEIWLTRRNVHPLPERKVRKDYHHVLYLTFHYEPGRETGFPSSKDNDAFEEIEEKIVSLCNPENTLFVAVVFMPKVKDYLFYSNTPHEMGDIFQPFIKEYPQFKVEFSGHPDEEWDQYDSFG